MTRVALVTFDAYMALFDIAGSLTGRLREATGLDETLSTRGYALALLSNGDRDMLQALAGRLAVPFAQVFSSEDAGAYKPHPALYALPMRTPGLERAQLLHVAGAANDALGATAAGIRCYWSNRTGDVPLDPAYTPACEGHSLEGLLDILP